MHTNKYKFSRFSYINKHKVTKSARCCSYHLIACVWNGKPLRKWVVDLPAGLVPGTQAANQSDDPLGRRPTWTVRASRSCAERNCARAPLAQNRQSRSLMSGWRSHDQLTWNANVKILERRRFATLSRCGIFDYDLFIKTLNALWSFAN